MAKVYRATLWQLVPEAGELGQGRGEIGEALVEAVAEHFSISFVVGPVLDSQSVERHHQSCSVHAVQTVDEAGLFVDGLGDTQECQEMIGFRHSEWSQGNGYEIDTDSPADQIFRLDGGSFLPEVDHSFDPAGS